MTDELEAATLPLLSLCAQLYCFDHDILHALGPSDEVALSALLASDRVQRIPDMPDAFRLLEHVQEAALAWLRAERPGDELVHHERAFEYFLQQMCTPHNTERRIRDERCCFHHLSALRLMLGERREWSRIRQCVARVRA